ncbi:ParB N-terminal domain-containing protein [Enterococcus durans]|uniref:ParB N-terminal domain-containing protein n=1 Tax=Enterococcus durans TaxID=53345 RepID=UPI0039A6168E
MDSIYGEIYLASEYDQFKLIKGNRQISTNIKLEESIKSKGILRPIIVNSNMEILDGQHRYIIAKKYNLSLPYYVSVSKSIEDIIVLNNTTNRWKIEDYIHTYKEDGLIDYILLEKLIKEYKNIALMDICCCAQGHCKKSRLLIEIVKEGKFKFYNYEEFLICLNKFQQFIYLTRIKCAVGVFFAFFELYTVKKFDFTHFIERINKMDIKSKIIGIRNEKRILKMFVETYNYNLRKTYDKYIEYRVNKDRSITILEEMSEALLIQPINESDS